MSNYQVIDKSKIVLFTLDEPRYALYLSTVERVVNSVEVTSLPKAPEIVLGVINVQGDIMPVIDIRKRFNLITHDVNLDDSFIIARTSKRLVVLVVDSVDSIIEIDNNKILNTDDTLHFADYLSGVVDIGNNIILINDLDKFLSLDEEKALSESLMETL